MGDRLGVSLPTPVRPSRSRYRIRGCSRRTRQGQAFIAADALSVREGTAGLLAASFIIDRLVARAARRVRQPALLMLAGQDRIVDNARTLAYFEQASVGGEDGHHISRGAPHPGIRT